MSMWKSVINDLEKIGLPLLGGAVGGPGGAAIGKVIADKLGCPDTPDAVQAALKTSPDAAVKLASIEKDLKMAQIAYMTTQSDNEEKQVEAVNKTLQTEAMGGSFWQKNHHAFESSFALFWLFCMYFLLPVLGMAVPVVPVEAFVMVGAILGVTAWKRGNANTMAAMNKITKD